MKKNVKNILAIVIMFLFAFTITDVYAQTEDNIVKEETTDVVVDTTKATKEVVPETKTPSTNTNTNDSRWEAMQPVYTKTSDGIEIKGVWTVDGWNYHWDVTYTIPSDYDKESIVFSPELFEALAQLQQREDVGAAIVVPGNDFYMTIHIINNSKYTYNYDETSFIVYPDQQVEYDKLVAEDTTKDDLFNGLDASDLNIFRRTYNTAMRALIPGIDNSKLTDEVIDEALKKAGYANGIKDYAVYLLNFYNTKYRTNYTRLDQFSYGIIREILGEIDPVYNKNSAWVALGVKNLIVGIPGNRKSAEQIQKIDEAVKKAEFNSAIDYLLYFYNTKFNDNAKNLSELCDAAHDKFFEYHGTELTPSILETNPELVVLHYDYFYNKLVSINFKDEDINNDNSEINSVGEYMRDETKGDAQIMESIGSLGVNTTNTINDIQLSFNGSYMINSYQNYEFMAHMSMSYSALKGNLIVRYVDVDGNELTESLAFTEMVGKDYLTKAKDFENYVLVRIEGAEEGKYIDGTQIVTYVYEKAATGSIVVDPTEIEDTNIPNTGIGTDLSLYGLLLSLFVGFNLVVFKKKILINE